MKINNRDLSSNKIKKNSVVKNEKSTDSTQKSFQSKLAEINSQEVKKRLDKLLNIVDREGKKLKETLDMDDLLSYKRKVQHFLRILQKEFVQAKQSFSWDDTGNVKTHTIIEKVDHNLEILQKLFLQEQADVLEVVRKIDEIRGLLLDLYI